jgi:hypothetical protein
VRARSLAEIGHDPVPSHRRGRLCDGSY